jgi:hypothetical protein
MFAALVRVWAVAMLLALFTAHPAVRSSAAWALSLLVPYEISAPWHSLEQEPSRAAKPVRDGLA